MLVKLPLVAYRTHRDERRLTGSLRAAGPRHRAPECESGGAGTARRLAPQRVRLAAATLGVALGVAASPGVAFGDDRRDADGDPPSSRTIDVESMEIHGYVERIRIDPEGIVLSARMDTGATSSSLNAINQRRFRRGGERWIEFDILDPTDESETIRIQRPIERFVRIVRHEGEQRRPVVKMTFCIGTKQVTADTTLIDRTNLTYQALVGRAHLAGHVLVDSSERYLMDPACPAPDADD